MITFPNAKINLGLHNIISKRNDGFHNLESVFLPIDFKDILEINLSNKDCKFKQSGININCLKENNIVYKAMQKMLNTYSLPEINMHLHKNIPSGAGLGGGSSDASFALKTINDMFKLKLNEEELSELSLSLGSDCPFFINNKPSFVHGKGELMEPVNYFGPRYGVLIIPNIHISTQEAYSGISPSTPKTRIMDILYDNPDNWKNSIENDFENHLFKKYETLTDIKEELYKSGAIYASMSGSGSSIYGLFDNTTDMKNLKFEKYGLVKKFNVL